MNTILIETREDLEAYFAANLPVLDTDFDLDNEVDAIIAAINAGK